jgi:hypothetical protein
VPKRKRVFVLNLRKELVRDFMYSRFGDPSMWWMNWEERRIPLSANSCYLPNIVLTDAAHRV